MIGVVEGRDFPHFWENLLPKVAVVVVAFPVEIKPESEHVNAAGKN